MTGISKAVIDDPQLHENKHVHAVYDQIAPHFSSTRYKPWPIVAKFLSNLPTGFVGLDSGTGNGKYLLLPADRPGSLWTIGLDRSKNLLNIARAHGSDDKLREVVLGDVLGNSWRSGVFDFAISIATIHHLATYGRRKLAIQRLLQCVSSRHGCILIYVWAIEQDDLSKRRIPTDNTGPLCERTGTDVFIPWVFTQQENKISHPPSSQDTTSSTAHSPGTERQVFHRYYHMFSEGELIDLVYNAAEELGLHVGARDDFDTKAIRGVEVVQNGWERSNYYVELRCWEK